MSFLEGMDAVGLIEDNAQKIVGLEDSEAQSLIEIYRRMRKQLQDKLFRLAHTGREGTFTAQQYRVALFQMDTSLTALEGDLFGRISDTSELLATEGVQDLMDESDALSEYFTGTMQPLNIDASLVASDTSNALINRFEESITNYGLDLRQKIVQGLTDMVSSPTSLQTVVETINNFFAGEEWQVMRIARTELHNIYSTAKLNGMRQALGDVPEMKKTLFHPKDSRTADDSKFLMRNWRRMIKAPDEPFEYWWSNKAGGSFEGPKGSTSKWYHRVFQNPPDRPNDRAILVPYQPSWQ